MTHSCRVDQDLILLDVTSDNGYLSDTSGRQQSRTDRPVGKSPQLLQRGAVGRQPDDQQLTEDGGLRTQGRGSDVLGKRLVQRCQLLGYDLTGPVDVRTPVEFDPDDRKSCRRGGADTPDVGRTVDGRFDREGNRTFYLFGGHAAGLGHNDDRRGVQVGKDVNFRVAGRKGAYHHEDHAYDHYQQSVA